MGYFAEKGKSELSSEESVGQKIATRLSREFYISRFSSPLTTTEKDNICNKVETNGEIYGFNLFYEKNKSFRGTFQTRNKSCREWVRDINPLMVINSVNSAELSKYSFSKFSDYFFNDIRYYIDLNYNYIYINQPVRADLYTLNKWPTGTDGSINIERIVHLLKIDNNAISDLLKGESVTTDIYQDGYTHKNIISILTPVFYRDKVKGILITDINITHLALSFKTIDRPLLWRFISSKIIDDKSGNQIYFNKPYLKTFNLINHKEKLTGNYTLYVQVDAIYVIATISWLFVIYIVGTWALCRYLHKQLIRHILLSRDNITDVMTRLYNRKVLTPELEHKIHSLAIKNISITIVAIDSDGLKKINDTRGHYMGDLVIQKLGSALGNVIRKSDYGIRLGGDEFCLILIDYTLSKARDVVNRIQEQLLLIDHEKLVKFSWGAYQFQPDDTLEVAMLNADKLLYQHKRSKYTSRK